MNPIRVKSILSTSTVDSLEFLARLKELQALFLWQLLEPHNQSCFTKGYALKSITGGL